MNPDIITAPDITAIQEAAIIITATTRMITAGIIQGAVRNATTTVMINTVKNVTSTAAITVKMNLLKIQIQAWIDITAVISAYYINVFKNLAGLYPARFLVFYAVLSASVAQAGC
jgi:hypothetical protein